MKPETDPALQNVALQIIAHVQGFDGRSGSITLHIHAGKVTRIEDKKYTPLATTGLPEVA